MSYLETDRRFVAVLNRRHPAPRLLNALGHLTAGLAAQLDQTPDYLAYRNRHAGMLASISRNPFIILEAKNGSQLQTLREALLAAGLPAQAFVNQMIGASAQDQLDQTLEAPADGLDYVAVATYGEAVRLSPMTRRFSLYKAIEPAL